MNVEPTAFVFLYVNFVFVFVASVGRQIIYDEILCTLVCRAIAEELAYALGTKTAGGKVMRIHRLAHTAVTCAGSMWLLTRHRRGS